MRAEDEWPGFEGGIPSFNFHRFTVRTAEDLAFQSVEDAWEHGFAYVRLIHGARYSTHHFGMVARSGGAGIKWRLRSMLRTGEFGPYACGPRSRKHVRGPVALIVALKPNPFPDDADAPWTPCPEREYEPGGRHPWRL